MTALPIELGGILLVGGAARRFGGEKALAEVEGEAMAARAWDLLGRTCLERLAVGRSYPTLGIEAVADSLPGAGPLAALADGLARLESPWAIVLPCDVPRLGCAAIEALAREAARRAAAGAPVEAVIPLLAGVPRPLPGLYARSTLPVARRLLHDGRRALRDLLGEVPYAAVAPIEWGDPSGTTLRDVDVPADLDRPGIAEA